MREQHGIKELQVVERFTGPEETDRHGDGAAQGDNATTLRRAIQLRDHEARERHRGRKHFRLPNGVLSHGGVEDERSEEHTSELQSQSNLVCRLLLEKKKKKSSYISSNTAQQDAYRCYWN